MLSIRNVAYLAQLGDDANAVSFLTRAGIVDVTISDAIFALVAGLKSAGVWDKLRFAYPFVGGSASAHSENLKSAAFPITWLGSVTHNAFGAISDGSTGYGKTGFICNDHLNINSAFLHCYGQMPFSGTSRAAIGSFSGGRASLFFNVPLPGSVSFNGLFDGLIHNPAGNLSTVVGNCLVNRTGAATEIFYTDGSQTGTVVDPVTTMPTIETYVLARNSAGAPISFYNKALQFAAVGDGLTPAQVTSYMALVDAFQVTLGRKDDVDANDFLVRAGITSETQASAVHTLVGSLKASGSLWSKLKIIYPFVGGNATAHSQNLKANTFPITWVGGVTHGAGGPKGNGATGYGDTGFVASAELATYTNGFVGGFCAAASLNKALFGTQVTRAAVYPNVGIGVGSLSGIFSGNIYASILPSDYKGNFYANRTAVDAETAYSDIGSYFVADVSTALPSISMYVLASNDSGTPVIPSDFDVRFFAMGEGLTETERLAYVAAVNAFQLALGRNVR